jgi:HD-GYP domain-containing protein (c-di-GMP phosphodiesterase class II)
MAFICCPIVSDGATLGILAVDNLNSSRPLVETDLRLLKGVASVLGISIKNAQLIEARERQMNSLLRVLGASIDARDPLTKGHSENVTLYAMGICDELLVEREYKEAIRVAALLHDYGKIGVPDAVLKKPGTLTDDEKKIVRMHARKTKDILKQVDFEGVFADVPDIAGGHHERYDGNGYPDNLRGEEIPLGARIIAVADFFEAITAMRHYRAPMTEENAIILLRSKSGTHFDPTVVDAFLAFYQHQIPHKPELRVLSA